MKFPSTIYANPTIPEGFYWVKINNVLTEECGATRPRIWVELEVGPMHEQLAGTRLCSIIHPTEKAQFIFTNFVNSFRVKGGNVHDAIGRWATVMIYPAEYEGSKYSAIKFVYQQPQTRKNALEIEESESHGPVHAALF